MTNQKSLLKPSIELVFASILWGFGFVAVVWTLPFLSPSALICYRFLIASVIGWLYLKARGRRPQDLQREFKLAIIAGLSIGLSLFLQTWGLQFTTATNSGFVTTLYVVFVPFMARLFLRERLPWIHWLFVGLALIGTTLVVRAQTLEMNKGDVLTLGCALMASLQIVYVASIADQTKDSLALNTFQSFWAGAPYLLMIPFEVRHGTWNLFRMNSLGWIGFLSLTLGSTLLGFFLQLRAQKQLSPSHASLLFLLESPFACFFAIWLLDERLTHWQMAGAALILGSCIFATIFEGRKSEVVS